MITNIVSIGNSKGIRIPKPLLEESGLGERVEIRAKKGVIRIVPAAKNLKSAKETALLSEKSLSDWSRKEEDVAWKSLQ